MSEANLIRPTPWDSAVFAMPTWELAEYSEAALHEAARTVGHHTVKVDPLADKRLLHEYDFYYCDTLIEPYCNAKRLRIMHRPETTISMDVDAEGALEICHGAFVHGRFHRDFNLPASEADLRYDNWLGQLLRARRVYGLYWERQLAGFIGYDGGNLVLHAVAEEYRGRGGGKYWWGAVCQELLAAGHREIRSSISAANLAALNLYASLGFAFGNPVDVYHRMTAE